jgi:hypothetical protein|tara:strand:+ start:2305 stop:2505 length:201 start_codon:yes stop_codon:yes gene_type:complete
MKNYFIIFIFILFVNCSFNENEIAIIDNNKTSEINYSNVNSFEEYVSLLSNKNKSKKYPDINNVPD